MKKRVLLMVFCAVLICANLTGVYAKESNLTKIYEEKIYLNKNLNAKNNSFLSCELVDDTALTLSVYVKENGKKAYTINGANSKQDKKVAFQLLNDYMETGSIERTNVDVTDYYEDFYGNEMGESQVNNNCISYTWSKYNAGKVHSGGVDKTWGGTSGSWIGNEAPGYIQLLQSRTISVSNASATLNISWPPGLSVSETKSKSTASDSTTKSNVDVFGAEHSMVEFDKSDIHNGNIKYCLVSDTAKIEINNFTYKASSSVKFNNAL
ncbi:MAG: hypothetical protein N4A63_15855 [Vallitalea sp.]|jgi:hypothetical protein|nr:hypothetical protein [Vallitalea sp.]